MASAKFVSWTSNRLHLEDFIGDKMVKNETNTDN
jgi:hypothetical protein